ncbi:MAG: hypothetical protein Q9218_004959 [Villophora microphyllina]
MTTPSSESADYNPRKRMRKGTHSCLECRRRKIRCIYEPNANTCNRCISKSLECTEQEYGDAKALGADKRKSMRQRTSELEGMIGQILTKLDSNTTTPQDAETKAAEALRSLRTELLPSTTTGADVLAQGPTGLASPTSERSDNADEGSRHFHNPPLLSLFDNAVLTKGNEQHDGRNRDSNSVSHGPTLDKHRRALTALKSLMPSREDVGIMVRASRQSLRIWQDGLRDCTYKLTEKFDQDEFTQTQDFICQSLHSEKLPVVMQTFACLAMTLQQLPGTFDSSTVNLPASPEVLQDHYITAVETLLASDDGLASTTEGLSCLLVQSRYYVNSGKPRKGWLTIRRALNFAQMLGFHRQSYDQQDPATINRKSIWLAIFQIERGLSLLLGYPSACLDAHYDNILAQKGYGPGIDRERFGVRMSVITGQIILRNQDSKSMTVAATLKIDQDLEEARASMPPEWWNPTPGTDSDVADTYDRFVARAFFHNVRILLHLPFMLKSNTDRRYDYSRIAALESSREMIHSYHCLRSPVKPLVAVCNVIDFQVFTSAMLLLVNLLGTPESSNPTDSANDAADWELIYRLTEDLRKVVNGEMGRGDNGVAAQAVTLLQDLSKAKDTYCDHAPNVGYQAVIPYFGKIKIRRGTAFRARSSASTTPSLLPSQMSQVPTPSDSSGTPINFGTDPRLSFESYFRPLPGDMQTWQDSSIDWAAMNDFELLNDWSWFGNSQDGQELTHYLTSVRASAIHVVNEAAVEQLQRNYSEQLRNVKAFASASGSSSIRSNDVCSFGEVFAGDHHDLSLDQASEELVDREEDVEIILFTSGTTSHPKGCLHTTRTLWHSTTPYFQDRLTWLPLMPPFHIAGLATLLGAWRTGHKVVVAHTALDPRIVLDSIASEEVSIVTAVPSMISGLVMYAQHARYDLSSLAIGMGGSMVSPDILKDCTDSSKLSAKFAISGYGMSESLPIFRNNPNEPVPILDGFASVGRIAPGSKAKICERGTRRTLRRGNVGQVHLGGPKVIGGYLNYTSDFLYVDDDGCHWIATEDQGIIDASGNAFIFGRSKDVIIRGGENISPAAAELCLQKIPAILEVQVVGIPDDIAGEVPVAVVRMDLGCEPAIPFLRAHVAKELGILSAPISILALGDLSLDEFPTTALGKVKKHVLSRVVRDLLTQRASSDEPLGHQSTERSIACIWSRLLQIPIEKLSYEDNIVGQADSLILARFQGEVRSHLNVDVGLDVLRQHDSVRVQARYFDAHGTSREEHNPSGPKCQASRQGPPTIHDMAHANGDSNRAL